LKYQEKPSCLLSYSSTHGMAGILEVEYTTSPLYTAVSTIETNPVFLQGLKI